MNRTYKFSALWMMCLTLFNCLSFTACDNGEYLDTNQYKGGISLNVFGPSPVARGGELRFLGSGMDKVTAVVIPGCDDITDIKVISSAEIRVTVPQTAEPGYVVLKTAVGNITTKTKLTFTEPISLEEFTPKEIKPGAELTITGNYLNLINEIIFTDNVSVKSNDFTQHERKVIKLIVPQEAQTGKIIISDGAELPNWIYSDEELKVTLPSVDKTLDLTNKKPGETVTVTGKDLDLVKKVLMPNNDAVEFKVTDEVGDGKEYKLTFTLPDNTSDGAIVMVPASGVKVAIANIGMALPTNVVATPVTGLRAGDIISLKGLNMELVSAVVFPGVTEAVQPNSKSATEVKVTMPAMATSGNLQLNTNSGKSVNVALETAKPINLSYSSNSVPAGEALTINGSNLDVVSSILFGGNVEVSVSPKNASTLTVNVPTTAETGKLTLKMANGEFVEASSLTVEKPICAYIPSLPEKLISGKVVVLNIQNGDKLTSVLLNGVATQFINDIDKGTLTLNPPSTLNGTYTLKLISTNGEISYNVLVVPNESIIWEGHLTITWGEGGRVMIPAESFLKVSASTTMRIYFDQIVEVWGQAQFNYGDWSGITFSLFNQTLIPTNDDIYGWTFASRVLDLTLTQDILNNIQAKKDASGNGIIIQGDKLIFNKVTIVNK